MAKINFKKVLSFLMALCMIMSLFTCVSILPASAATSEKMFVLKSTAGYPTVTLISTSSNQLVPGNSYTLTSKFYSTAGDYSEAEKYVRTMGCGFVW